MRGSPRTIILPCWVGPVLGNAANGTFVSPFALPLAGEAAGSTNLGYPIPSGAVEHQAIEVRGNLERVVGTGFITATTLWYPDAASSASTTNQGRVSFRLWTGPVGLTTVAAVEGTTSLTEPLCFGIDHPLRISLEPGRGLYCVARWSDLVMANVNSLERAMFHAHVRVIVERAP